MAHAKFTKETVFEAADKLVATSEKPTITRIRDIIGGGSPNDITAWMKEWRTQRQKLSDAQKVPAPGSIRDQATLFLSEFVTSIWDTARTEADNKLKTERQALSDAQAELEQETSESLEMAENLNAENLGLKTKIQELEAAGTESDKQIDALQSQIERDRKSIDDLFKEKDRLTKEQSEARADAKQANTQAAKLSGELGELRRHSACIKSELETLKLQAEVFKRERDVAQTEKEASIRETNAIKSQAVKQQTALDAALLKIDALQAEVRQSRNKQAEAEREAAALQGELKSMTLLAEKPKINDMI
jgi:chromosome segregation ATPase